MSTEDKIWKPHVTVASVIEEDGKFLLVEETINGERVLNQPAGHLESNETILEAVVRETLEETAWDIQPRHLINISRLFLRHKNRTYIRFNVASQAVKFNPERELDTGINCALWLTAEEIINSAHRHRSPLVIQSIKDYNSGLRYPLSLLQDMEILADS